MKRVLCNEDIPAKLRVRLYDATVINILLWGCESWALTAELRRKLEVCHHRFLRKMVNITIYDVKDNHISNEQVREELTCYKFHQSLESDMFIIEIMNELRILIPCTIKDK